MSKHIAVKPFFRTFGNDIDDATYGIGAPKRRLGAFQHFNTVYVRRIDAREIKPAAGRCRVIDDNAIDDDQRLCAGGSADSYRCHASERTVLVDGNAWHCGDGIEDEVGAQGFDIVGRQNGHA